MIVNKIKLIKPHHILKQINKLAPRMRKLTDEELKNQTQYFRKQLKAGKTVDDILPEAYATMREADYRILGEFPYDVQVLGAIVLNEGAIAEMKTGEGKTLTATMPLYLNAIAGKGAMLVTTSAYLAGRDEEDLAPVYQWMGLTVSTGFLKGEEKDTAAKKRERYNSDIVYTTASSLAFDYLFNNLATNEAEQYLRPFNYVVIDEVDDVLLDEAETPFVVSSSPSLQSNLYGLADRFVKLLVPKRDYRFKQDEKIFWLTYNGVKKAEKYFRVDNLFALKNRELYRHIILALSAYLTMKKGHDYLVVKDKVVLLDETDGRLKNGVQVGTGLHQAVETKENVKLTNMQKTAASITFPALFSLFKKVSGMSGTAKVDENEFIETYGLKVIQIPTRKPVIRKDYPDIVYLTIADKLMAAIGETIRLHEQGRPVLLVAGSVENSEIISELLLNDGIAHNVLNAFNAAKEAAIIKEAGQEGAVTVATNMAGRGTDIKLGKGIKEKGGLAVIGTEMLSPRVKLQLAGRAGRQGDPGTSRFYVSLEDSYIAKASTNRQKRHFRHLIKKKEGGKNIVKLHNPITKLGLYQLQTRVASNGTEARMRTNKYQIALNIQTRHFYKKRKELISIKDLQSVVDRIINDVLDIYLNSKKEWSYLDLREFLNTHVTYKELEIPKNLNLNNQSEIKKYLIKETKKVLKQHKKALINKKQLNDFYHQVILASLDRSWIDQVDYLNNLQIYASAWSFSGRDADYIQQSFAYDSFSLFWDKVKCDCFDKLMLSQIKINDKGQLIVVFN